MMQKLFYFFGYTDWQNQLFHKFGYLYMYIILKSGGCWDVFWNHPSTLVNTTHVAGNDEEYVRLFTKFRGTP